MRSTQLTSLAPVLNHSTDTLSSLRKQKSKQNINMKFLAGSFVVIVLAAVALAKPTEIESLEPAKVEESAVSTDQVSAVAPRDKRGLLFGAAYTAPVAYTAAAYTAPVAYTSAYSYPYAYSAYSAGYPYYAAAYSTPYYLA